MNTNKRRLLNILIDKLENAVRDRMIGGEREKAMCFQRRENLINWVDKEISRKISHGKNDGRAIG